MSTIAGMLAAAAALSIIVEAIIEYFLESINSKYKQWVAAAISVAVTIVYGVDALGLILAQFNVVSVIPPPYDHVFGSLLTGLLISRGSNVFNDLVQRINTVRLPAATLESVEHTLTPLRVYDPKAPIEVDKDEFMKP